jgi:hypothetical protein
MVTPDAKPKAVAHACTVHAVSQRRACGLEDRPLKQVGGGEYEFQRIGDEREFCEVLLIVE